MKKSPSQAVQMFLAMNRMRRAWRGISFCPELNKSQFWTLFLLYHGFCDSGKEQQPPSPPEPMTLSALAQAMQQSMPAVSQRIRQLEEMGYVSRIPDPRDKRSTGLELSEEGKRLMESACTRMTETLDTILTVLDPKEIETMFQTLQKLAEAMEAQQQSSVTTQSNEKEKQSC